MSRPRFISLIFARPATAAFTRTGGCSIGVIHQKASTALVINIVNCRASRVLDGDLVNENFHPLTFENRISLARLVFKPHAVLEPGAASPRNIDPQGVTFVKAALAEQIVYHFSSGRGEYNGSGLNRSCYGYLCVQIRHIVSRLGTFVNGSACQFHFSRL